MHTYTLPVQRMEYASTMHGKHLYHAWNTPVLCMEYTSTSWNTAQGFPKLAKTCSHLPMILLISKTGSIGNNSRSGYSVQGLAAKAKDIVANS